MEKTTSSWNTTYVFPSFFIYEATDHYTEDAKLATGAYEFHYEKVHRWTRFLKSPLWNHRLVLYPMNFQRVHWGLGVCVSAPDESQPHIMRHKVMYLDSMYSPSNELKMSDLIHKHFENEYDHKYKRYGKFKPKYSFKAEFTPDEVPQQHNTCDCGVFTCAFAFCLTHNIPFQTFQQKDMDFFRKHIILSVSQGTLHPIISHNVNIDNLSTR